jgi:hypothetical protein
MCAVTKPALAFNKQTEKMAFLEQKCFGHRKRKILFCSATYGVKAAPISDVKWKRFSQSNKLGPK